MENSSGIGAESLRAQMVTEKNRAAMWFGTELMREFLMRESGDRLGPSFSSDAPKILD